MENLHCAKCNDRFQEKVGNDELGSRDIVIKGATVLSEAVLLCGAIDSFFSWPSRNFLNSEGFSVAMKVTGYGKKKWPWQKTSELTAVVFSTPNTVVVSRVKDDDTQRRDNPRRHE